MEGIKAEDPDKVIDVTADKGYNKAENMIDCLHAGVIPDAYKDVILDMEVKEVRRKVSDEPEQKSSDKGSVYGTQEET